MKIFVSYRRNDSSGWTGRLVADLATRFSAANVFQDIHSIEPGMNFADAINATLVKSNCTLVVIGPGWLSATDGTGDRRLDNLSDYVRLEVAIALQRKSLVIPVLVGGAKMPTATELPDDLKSLSELNAVELTDRKWDADVRDLITMLAGKIWWRRITFASLGLIQVLILFAWVYEQSLSDRVAEYEAKGSSVRSSFIQKMQVGSDECMAGTWPIGAIKGKTYKENGNMVTEPCQGVSGALDYFGRFFRDDELWKLQPSGATASTFEKRYTDIFDQGFSTFLSTSWPKPLSSVAISLATRARDEIASQAHKVVQSKQDAGQSAQRLRVVHEITRAGLYWTIIAALAVLYWLTRGRLRVA